MDRDEAYSVLSDLIFKGFTVMDFRLESRHIVFKSINEKEFELIKLYAGDNQAIDYKYRFNLFFIIFSIFLLDNQNILKNRNEQIKELFDQISALSDTVIKKIIANLNNADSKIYEAVKYIEGFSYTDHSRNLWKLLKNTSITSAEFTGIPGTENIGTNVCQESWILINHSLDFEEQYNKDFSMALLITSGANPKGARQTRNQHSASTHVLEERRVYLAEVGYADSQRWTANGWAVRTDTAHELVAELERQMTGHKDRHDLLIEFHLKSVRDRIEKKRKEVEMKLKKLRDDRDGQMPLISGSQREMTPEEVAKMIAPTKKKMAKIEKTLTENSRMLKKISPRIMGGK